MRQFLFASALAFSLVACSSEPADTETADEYAARVGSPGEGAQAGEDGGDTDADAAPALDVQPGAVVEDAAGQIPTRFRGIWDYIDGSCDPASDLRMEVRASRIGFYESSGDVTGVTDSGGEQITVSLAMSGEGETWDDTLGLALVDGGRFLETSQRGPDGGALRRKRCP